MSSNEVPEIDLDELMEKIRAEVLRRKSGVSTGDKDLTDITMADEPTYNQMAGKWSQVENAISIAEQFSQVGTRLPGMHTFRGWRKNIAQFTGKIYLRISQVITRDQRTFNGSILTAVSSLLKAIKQIDTEVNKNIENLNEFKSNTEKQESDILSRMSNMNEELSSRSSEIENLELKLKKAMQKIEYLKASVLSQDRSIALLTEEARRYFPGPSSTEKIESYVEKASDFNDALYFEFEDQFRGTRQDIKERQKIYLPYIREAGAGTEERPVLDLGCGRGEWLELLKENGFITRGVDTNTAMISFCIELCLDAVQSDVLKYLRDLPDESLGAVTGFHIVEHLPFDVLLKLFDETVRVLKTGGVAIFETPNPENIQVGSCNFYFDPTHRNPLPGPLLKFMAETRGLCRVSLLKLHPYPESHWLSGSELADRFSQLFYGPQDYAVLGWKA